MGPRPPTTVLLIDLGNVVVWDPRPSIVREILRRERLDAAHVREAYYRVALHMASGSFGLPEGYRTLRRRFHWSISYPALREIVGSRALRVVPGVLPALRELRRKRTVRVVYASNVERVTWRGLCRKYHLDEYADGAALSFRLRALKPSRRFFREALRIARAPPSEVLYLDDLPENVRAARALGIRARRVRSREDTLAVLWTLNKRRSRTGKAVVQSM